MCCGTSAPRLFRASSASFETNFRRLEGVLTVIITDLAITESSSVRRDFEQWRSGIVISAEDSLGSPKVMRVSDSAIDQICARNSGGKQESEPRRRHCAVTGVDMLGIFVGMRILNSFVVLKVLSSASYTTLCTYVKLKTT